MEEETIDEWCLNESDSNKVKFKINTAEVQSMGN